MNYRDLVQVYEELDSTSKRLEKTHIISELLKKTSTAELDMVLLLLQGKVFPPWNEKEIGVAGRLMAKAISQATGFSAEKVEEEWKKTGDLGNAAFNLTSRKRQNSLFARELIVGKVYSNIQALAEFEGKGTVEKKLSLISELLVSATPLEAKYIVRTILETMRMGVGAGSIRDAIVWAYFGEDIGVKYKDNAFELSADEREKYKKYVEAIQHGYDIANEFSAVVKAIREYGIDGAGAVPLAPGKPVNAMLFVKAKDIPDAFSIVGKPAAFEYKIDGFRLQVHKGRDGIRLFTRRLDNVTEQFPEIVEYAGRNVKGESFILDGEAVGYDRKTGKFLPFQSISQRIKRKYQIEKMAEDFPVELVVFDILECNGKSLLNTPFSERRKILEGMVGEAPGKILLVKEIVTDDEKTVEGFYTEALSLGFEGIMGKNLGGVYKPGARVGYGVKIKPTMEPLDLAVVAAEYGEGKRSGWLTSYVLACWDKDRKNLLHIGKASTGLKELEEQGLSFKQMTDMLKPLVIKSSGKIVTVKPEVIIEVLYEEIQKSPTYSSGYALRFPRITRLRSMEKGLKDINTIGDVEKMYAQQRGRG